MDLAGKGWRRAELDPGTAAICAYAEKLTETPAAMREADVELLRGHGYSDFEIHDAIQVVSYFNYINRVADAVHVDLEPEMDPYPDPEQPGPDQPGPDQPGPDQPGPDQPGPDQPGQGRPEPNGARDEA